MADRAVFKLNIQELSAPLAVVFAVLMVVIPLHPLLLDFFMVVSLAASVLVLLITVTSRKVTDFSQFPTVLLVLTIFTLGLNVSSTRMILTHGSRLKYMIGGEVVKAFSSFVIGVGGNQGIVIGFVIFIIITAVQIFVITKGAKRTAEVNARFMLDGMPMKMAELSSEYSQGAITDEELRIGKQELQLEVDLSRAMDGASNFVSGSAKIGIFITVINLLGGIIIGMTINREDFATALATYPQYTIGDGLFSQIPSLLVSVATGLLVSRSASHQPLGADVYKQFTQSSPPFLVSGAVIAILGVLPGFPWFIMVPLGALLVFTGIRLQTLPKTDADKAQGAEEQKKKQAGSPADAGMVPRLDPISLEIGFALIPLVDQAKGAELLERVTRIRREAAVDMGLIVPQVRIIDNMRLDPYEYCIKIKGVEVGRSKIRMGWYLCVNTGNITEEIPGEKTVEPTYKLPALWITDETRERAERAGYAVVDPPTIIATHLTQIIKTHAAEILGRQEVQRILEQIKKDYPAVVDGVLSIGDASFTVGEIQKVMQGLLREQVSVRNNVVILETLADFAKITHHTGLLIEKVRQRLGRQICLQYVDETQTLHVMTVSQEFQKKLIASRVELMDGWGAALDPASHRAWISAVSAAAAAMQNAGYTTPAILCPEEARPLVRSSTEREMPGLVVLSISEIPSDIKLESVGEIKGE